MLLHGKEIRDGTIPGSKLEAGVIGAGGANKQIQFNQGGNLSGDTANTFNPVSKGVRLAALDSTEKMNDSGLVHSAFIASEMPSSGYTANVSTNYATILSSTFSPYTTGSNLDMAFSMIGASLFGFTTIMTGAMYYSAILGTSNTRIYSTGQMNKSGILFGDGHKVTATGNMTNSAIIGGTSNSLSGWVISSVLLGTENLTVDGIDNTVFMPKVRIGQGSSAVLPTTGDTHTLGISATGEIIKTELSAFLRDASDNTLPRNKTFTSVSPSGCMVLDGAPAGVTGTWNVQIGYGTGIEKSGISPTIDSNIVGGVFSYIKIDGSASSTLGYMKGNVAMGYSTIMDGGTFTASAGLRMVGNVALGSYTELSFPGGGANREISYNFILGQLEVKAEDASSIVKANILQGLAGDVVAENGFTVSYSTISGLPLNNNVRSTRGDITHSVWMSNSTTVNVGDIKNSVVMGTVGMTLNGIQESVILGTDGGSINSATAVTNMLNSGILASRNINNGVHTMTGSAIIAVDGYTMTAALSNTVLMPQLRLGRGTNGALPGSTGNYLLGYNSSTGEVSREDIPSASLWASFGSNGSIGTPGLSITNPNYIENGIFWGDTIAANGNTTNTGNGLAIIGGYGTSIINTVSASSNVTRSGIFTGTYSYMTSSGAVISNSAIIGGYFNKIEATSTLTDNNAIIGGASNILQNAAGSAIIGGNTITLTASDTVAMPKVRMGLGTGGALPALSSGYDSLGIDQTTGEVGTFAAPSDARLKNIIQKMDPLSAMNFVRKLNPVEFTWNMDKMPGNDQDPIYGFIAQEVATLRKEMVHEVFEKDGVKYMGIKDKQIVALLTAAMKNLDKRVTELENK